MTKKWEPIDNHTFKVGDRVKLRNGEEDEIINIWVNHTYPIHGKYNVWTENGRFFIKKGESGRDIVSVLQEDNQYYCKNGDLIEVGKEYNIHPYGKSVLKYISKGREFISEQDEEDFVHISSESCFQSLWQEQPDEDGWIEHTTGKQPVADDVMVEVKLLDETLTSSRYHQVMTADEWDWEDVDTYGCITHYRIVEDKQEPEETLMDYLIVNGRVQHASIEGLRQQINELAKLTSEYLQKKGI
jgi:hypothetical protein